MYKSNITENVSGPKHTPPATTKRKQTKKPKTGDPGVTVQFGRKKLSLSLSILASRQRLHQALLKCGQEVPTLTAQKLLTWDEASRWNFLDALATLKQGYRIKVPGKEQVYKDSLTAVLAIAQGPADVEGCGRSQRAAIEAAASCFPDALESAVQQIVKRFRELGVKGMLPQTVLKSARNVAGQTEPDWLTDPAIGAQRFLVHQCDHHKLEAGEPVLRYFRDEFFLWSGSRWIRTPDKELVALITRYLQDFGDVKKLTRRFVNDVVANLQGMTLVNNWRQELPIWVENDSAKPSPYMSFNNGIVDATEFLSAGEMPELRPHDPRHFDEVQLPYDYDPEAKCGLWEQTLGEIFPPNLEGDNRRSILQEFMGWTLIRSDTSLEKFLIMVGDGANGKSTVLRIWEQLLGADNVSHVPLDGLSSEFRPYDMLGKLANIAFDMNRMDKVQEGQLKSMTSGEPMQFNRKGKALITARPTARLIFATNHLPQITDRSEGVWRRMMVMPFLEVFDESKRDRRRATNLEAELPGIFNWALAGARRLYKENGFSTCSVCEGSLDDHRFNSDPFMGFVDAYVDINPEGRVSSADLYKAYKEHCEKEGRLPKSNTEIGKQVLKIDGVEKKRRTFANGDRGYEYWGICLATSGSLVRRCPST